MILSCLNQQPLSLRKAVKGLTWSNSIVYSAIKAERLEVTRVGAHVEAEVVRFQV